MSELIRRRLKTQNDKGKYVNIASRRFLYIMWNSIALTFIVVTELDNAMKYGGGDLI